MIQDTLLKGLFVLFAILTLIMLAAPFALPYGELLHLDGSPSVMDHDWSGYGVAGVVYALGDLLCHQELARSFMLNGSQLPVCARDLGLLMGFTAGLAVGSQLKMELASRRFLFTGLMFMLLTAIEWIMEQAAVLDSQELRFSLGILSGIGAALVVGHALYRNAGYRTPL